MKKIYKSLISILIISMLATVGMAAKPGPGPSPTPTSTAEQVQDQRLTTLEANDTNQSINNTEQQNWISGLYEGIQEINKQLALMGNRVTNLESSVTNLVNDPYPAVYSAKTNDWLEFKDTNTHELSNLTFNLPKNAYVVVQTDTDIDFWNSSAGSYIFVDNIQRSGAMTGDANPSYTGSSEWGEMTHLEDSIAVQLNAGQHSVSAKGSAWKPAPWCNCWDGRAKIVVTAYDIKGNVQSIQVTDTASYLPNRISKK